MIEIYAIIGLTCALFDLYESYIWHFHGNIDPSLNEAGKALHEESYRAADIGKTALPPAVFGALMMFAYGVRFVACTYVWPAWMYQRISKSKS